MADVEMAEEEEFKEEAMESSEEDNSSDSTTDQDPLVDQQEEQLRLRVEELREQLAGNVLYYDGHVNLISALRELQELEEARKAREKMSEVYPLTAELWLDWIKDEQKVCTTQEEKKYIMDLFSRAVKDYINVGLWVEYVMFMLGCGDIDATRNIGEQALTAVGIHVAEGILVWQVVLMVEKQVYAGLLKPGTVPSEQDMKDQEKQLHRIQTLYRRQMRVPLLNTDFDALIEEASDVFEGGIENHMKEDLKKSQNKLQEKVPFENELIRAADDTEKLAVYRRYITHTKEVDSPAAVQNLYERAVADHCLDAGLWEEYIRFVMRTFPGMNYVILPVCERSQRNCPWSPALCELHITALQMFAVEGEEETTAAKIKGALEKGIGCGIQSGSDATRMWMAYLVFLRRQIDWDSPDMAKFTSFSSVAEQAINSIDKYFGEEADIESRIPRFLAQVTAELIADPAKAREIWNETIMKRNNNYNNANMWLEFIRLERGHDSVKYCRKLFKRALERVWDGVELIGSAYQAFEEETGTLESMEEFNRRYENRMKIVTKKREEDALKQECNEERSYSSSVRKAKDKAYIKEKKKGWKKNSNSISVQDSEVFKQPFPVAKSEKGVQRSAMVQPSSRSNGRVESMDISSSATATPTPNSNDGPTCKSKKGVAPPPGFPGDVAPPPGFPGDVPPPGYPGDVAPLPGFPGDVAPPPGYPGDVAPPPGYQTDDSPSPTKSTPESSKKRKAEFSYDEQIKILKEEKRHGVLTKNSPKDDMCTVFLSNLDFSADKDAIYPVFQQCGDIADFRLVKDYKCRSKGFGYLVFKTHEGAVNALKLDRALVNGRPVYVSSYDPENHTHKFKFATTLEENKLFVRGLPFAMTENDIREAFEPHGKIKALRLVTLRDGRSKGTCFIEYNDADTAEKVRQAMDGAEFEKKKITVLISNPPPKKSAANPTPKVLGQGSTVKKSDGMKQKGTFPLRPRVLQLTAPASPPAPDPSSEQQGKKMSNADFRSMFQIK